MPEQRVMHGFRTNEGLVKYDYNSLANLPSIAKVLFCTWDSLPNPSESLQGAIALVEDESSYDTPLICFKGKNNEHVWASFDGKIHKSIIQLQTPEIYSEEV